MKIVTTLVTGIRLWSLPLIALLAGCSSTVIRSEFRGYNGAYADMLNGQMLLNLARLNNGHPPYFLAIGPINSRYTVSAEAGAGGSVVDTDNASRGEARAANNLGVLGLASRTLNTVGNVVLGGNASGKIAGSSSPEFQFIPLNNNEVAKQFLEPVSTEVFYTLYQQGYPIDQLLRVMVERIETTLPSGRDLVLINSPTRGDSSSYFRFLRTCAILRELQRGGALLFDTRREFVPLSEAGYVGELKPPSASLDNALAPVEAEASTKTFTPTPEQLIIAEDKKLAWKQTGGRWQLGRYSEVPTFQLKMQNSARIAARMTAGTDARYTAAVGDVIELLNQGISVKTKATDDGQARSRLILRSYNRALEAVSYEQEKFDALLRKGDALDLLPASQRHPILRMTWSGYTGRLVRPLGSVRYAGQTYQITDPVSPPLDVLNMWNRDVFRLLVALGSQVTVDISKFQRQALEVR